MRYQDQHESQRKAWLYELQDDGDVFNALEWTIIAACVIGIAVELALGV
ncbi:MAG TPA: hypothetical protein VFV43_01560 [Limnobacter sp.]|nr:hypothetical protein [Limnobacter sp.]